MLKDISIIENFNEIIRIHEAFIDSTLETILINNPAILDLILTITNLANTIKDLTSEILKKI